MIDFFATLKRGYKILFRNAAQKLPDIAPKILTGTGTGLMMIGSALIARESCKSEVQEALRDAQRVLDEANEPKEEDTKVKKAKRVLKAKTAKGLKMVKVYKKGLIADVVGAALVTGGIVISEDGRKKAIAGAAAIGAEFAGYRAAVKADLGEEADAKYMIGRKAVNVPKKPKKGNKSNEPEEYIDEDGSTIVKDPSAFRILFSKENTPDIWSDNYDMRIANLEWIEALLTRQYRNTWETGGDLTLNDMRREMGGSNPRKWDVPIGGMFGRRYIKEDPSTHRYINLHFRDDEDFMNGRKDWCWLIFDCDPEPLFNSRGKRFKQIER